MTLPKDAFTIPAEATHFGRDAGGHYYVVFPSGSGAIGVRPGEIIQDLEPGTTPDPEDEDASSTPSSGTIIDYLVGGTQLNPMENSDQGYDQRGVKYDPSLQVSGSVSVTAGSKLVREVPTPTLGNRKEGFAERYVTLHVLDSADNASGMLPATVSWPGRGNDQPRPFNLDAIMAQHITPNIQDMSAAVDPPHDTAALAASVKRGMALLPQAGSGGGESGQQILPRHLTGAGNQNYGSSLGEMWCDGFASIFDSRTPEADRRSLVTSAIRTGIDVDDTWTGSGKILGGNGGINISYQGCVLFKRAVFGDSFVGFKSSFAGNIGCAFIHTAQTIAEGTQPHELLDSLAYPGQRMPWATLWRRVISTPTATTFTYDPEDPFADPKRLWVDGIMKIRRKSDGAEANVIAHAPTDRGSVSRSNNPTTITLDAPLDPPLINGDEFAYIPLVLPMVGEADWTVGGSNSLITDKGWSRYRAGGEQSYREAQRSWGLQVWVGERLSGGLPPEFDAAKAYIMLCETGKYPLCQTSNREFWNLVKGDLAA